MSISKSIITWSREMSLLKALFCNTSLNISLKDVGIYMCLLWHSFGKSEPRKTGGCLDKIRQGRLRKTPEWHLAIRPPDTAELHRCGLDASGRGCSPSSYSAACKVSIPQSFTPSPWTATGFPNSNSCHSAHN